MSKKYYLLILLVFVLIIGLWWHDRRPSAPADSQGSAGAHGGGRQGSGRGDGPQLPVPVTAGTVEARDMPIYLDGLGTVQAFNAVTVKTRVDGELDKIAFTEGQEVKTGDLLAQIDPRPYQALLDQAIAKKAEDEAQVANAKLLMQRDGELLAKKVLDQQTYDTQRFSVDQLVATVQADQASIDNNRTQVDYTHITAPLDGKVGIRQVDQGNIIHAADTGGIVVITQVKPISVVFTLPEQNLELIRQHTNLDDQKDPLKVLAVGRDNSGELGEGTLAVIDNLIDQTTGTIKLKATFPNEDERLWPGEFVNTRLLLTVQKGGIVVPASVIQRGPQGSYAFVIKEDMTVDLRTVKVGQIEDGVALIDDGLKAGERVVVDGQYKLQAGSKVSITSTQVGNGKPQPAAQTAAGDRAAGAGHAHGQHGAAGRPDRGSPSSGSPSPSPGGGSPAANTTPPAISAAH